MMVSDLVDVLTARQSSASDYQWYHAIAADYRRRMPRIRQAFYDLLITLLTPHWHSNVP